MWRKRPLFSGKSDLFQSFFDSCLEGFQYSLPIFQSQPQDAGIIGIRKYPGGVEGNLKPPKRCQGFGQSDLNAGDSVGIGVSQKLQGQVNVSGLDPGRVQSQGFESILDTGDRIQYSWWNVNGDEGSQSRHSVQIAFVVVNFIYGCSPCIRRGS